MLKKLIKFLPLLLLPLLLAGCATTTSATFTNLTPTSQVRNANNLYRVEVALASRQQSLRWESIEPLVNLGTEFYPMRPVLLMTNRWEALLPVPAGTGSVQYRYKFNYKYNAFGAKPQEDSATSPQYTLRILEK